MQVIKDKAFNKYMYNIVPHSSIGDIQLNSSILIIEESLGKGLLKKSPFFEDIVTGSYSDGIHIEFKSNKASFIGVLISLNPMLGKFAFANHSFEETLNFFRTFPGSIYTDDAVLISDHLSITAYFEDDKLLEVGIYSEEYKERLVGNLKTI